MPEHTPGPWLVTRVPIHSGGGSNTCFKIGPMVCCIYDDWRAREKGITEEQQVANARLMAAAPDLLEALKQIKVRIHFIGMPQEAMWKDGERDVPDWRKEIEMLEAALALAKGEK